MTCISAPCLTRSRRCPKTPPSRSAAPAGARGLGVLRRPRCVVARSRCWSGWCHPTSNPRHNRTPTPERIGQLTSSKAGSSSCLSIPWAESVILLSFPDMTKARAWYSRVGRWRGGEQGVRGQAVSPLSGECLPRAVHHSVSSTPSSNRTRPFRSSGFPTAFTGRRAEDPHDRAVQLIQPGLLEEGRRELAVSLAPALVLSPQTVRQLSVRVRR